jgi:hypothetical protein
MGGLRSKAFCGTAAVAISGMASSKETIMPGKSRVARFYAVFTAAFAAAEAARAGRQPDRRHLDALGIDPGDYRTIGR